MSVLPVCMLSASCYLTSLLGGEGGEKLASFPRKFSLLMVPIVPFVPLASGFVGKTCPRASDKAATTSSEATRGLEGAMQARWNEALQDEVPYPTMQYSAPSQQNLNYLTWNQTLH